MALAILSLSLCLLSSASDGDAAGLAGGGAEAREGPFDPMVRLDEVGLLVRGEAQAGVGFVPHFCGVRVVRVRPGSAAARAGLKPGDLISSANGRLVDDFRGPPEFSFGERRLGWLLRRRGRASLGLFRPKVGDIEVAVILP